jgi:UDP-glucose 4-epimerase
MKRLLLFGGTGYIGLNLALTLGLENEVTITGRNPVNKKVVPLLEAQKISFAKVHIYNFSECKKLIDNHDQIIFLVPNLQPHDSRNTLYSDYLSIILPSMKILKYAASNKKRVIFSSSGGAVYGVKNPSPHSEMEVPYPNTRYGELKLKLETYLIELGEEFDVKNLSVRISNPYGGTFGNMFTRGFVNSLVRSVQNHNEIQIWGTGAQIRDFIHINDLQNFINHAVTNGDLKGIFNCGTGVGHSLNEIIDISEKIHGKPLLVKRNLNYVEPIASNVLCIDKAKRFLGWEPEIYIPAGLSALFAVA